MQAQESKYEEPSVQILKFSLIEGWISSSQNYKIWLNKQPDPFAALSATLISLNDYSDEFSKSQKVTIENIQKFIREAINLFNEKLVSNRNLASPLTITQFLQAITDLSILFPIPTSQSFQVGKNQSYAVDTLFACCFKLFRPSTDSMDAAERFPPGAFLDVLKLAYGRQLISLEQFSRAIEFLGLFAKEQMFLPQASAGWKDWSAGVERELTTIPTLPSSIAAQLLNGFGNLAENYHLVRPLKADTINKLLAGLLKTGRIDQIRDGLRDLRTLIDYQGVRDIANLNVDILSALLSQNLKNEKEEKIRKTGSAGKTAEITIRVQIANDIAHIVTQINVLSSNTKPVQIKNLKALLNEALSSPEKPVFSFCQLLLAAGKLLQAGRQVGDDLKPQIGEILAFLDKECRRGSSRMKGSDLADALYALVLPAGSGWRDLKPTENLLKLFFEKLNQGKSKTDTDPESIDPQREIDLQKIAEFLCLTRPHQPLPPSIIEHLERNQPPIVKKGLQHQFGLYLQQQEWFKSRYQIIGEEVRRGYCYLDYVIYDKERKKYFNLEVDGRFSHQSHLPKNARRDAYQLSLKDHPVLEAVIRVPVPENLPRKKTLKIMEAQLERDLLKLSAPPSKLIDNKKTDIKFKKLPLPEVTLPEEHLSPLDVRIYIPEAPLKEQKEVKYKNVSVQDLRKAIQSYNDIEVALLVRQLQTKFQSHQEKIDVFLLAVDAANKVINDKERSENSKSIIRSLAVLGHFMITPENLYPGSPLQRAIEMNNTAIVSLFIDIITPRKFQKNTQAGFYPAWQEALKQAKKEGKQDIVELLEKKAKIVLPKITNQPDSTMLIGRNIPLAPNPNIGQNSGKKIAFLESISSQNHGAEELYKNQENNSTWCEQVRRLAESGNSQAQYILACRYLLLGDSEHLEEAAKWFKAAALQGHALSQTNLGIFYARGIGVSLNPIEAVRWHRRAADQGLAVAQYNLAKMYFWDSAMPKDREEGIKLYKQAAKQGFASAQFNLGTFYQNGEGVPKDLKEAVKWYRLAAKQNDAMAQFNLGGCYGRGDGVPQDIKEALKWQQKAAEQGYPMAEFSMGMCYEQGTGVTKDLNEAMKWFQKAAEHNYQDAQAKLWEYHSQGIGAEPHVVRELKEAAQGSAEAQYRLVLYYAGGAGVPQDPIEAAKWLVEAAMRNHPAAQCNLGMYWENGMRCENGTVIIPADAKQAVGWYRAAAAQNHAAAQYNFGRCHENGIGVPVDAKQAVSLYQAAAVQNYAAAQYSLGQCYENGIGVLPDVKQALEWYQKAAKQGYLAAQIKVKHYDKKNEDTDEKQNHSFGTMISNLGFSAVHQNQKKPPLLEDSSLSSDFSSSITDSNSKSTTATTEFQTVFQR